MDHRRSENFYIIVSPGLEAVCSDELKALGITPGDIEKGGVSFAGKLRDLYQANLHLRTASRILVRLAEFQSRDFPDLYRKAKKLPWGRFIKPDRAVSFNVTCHGSRLNHTIRISETLESALNQTLGRTTNPTGNDPQLVMVRIVDDQVSISVDSSGELLHRRGYRKSVTTAPLRETLAAGVLLLLNWDGSEALFDPMCGSGSFPLEGVLIAKHQAPGLNRLFAFMAWPGYRKGLWKLLCDEAQRKEVELTHPVSATDENPAAVAAALENCQGNYERGLLTIAQHSLKQHVPQVGHGLIVCNPPYGKRLSLGLNPKDYYAELGKELKRVFSGWRIAMICPESAFVKATGLPFKQIASLDNGGLDIGLFVAKS